MIQFHAEATDEDKVKLLQDLTRRLFKEWARACEERDQAMVSAACAKADWKACDRDRNQLLSNNHELHRQIAELRAQQPQTFTELRQSHTAKSVDELDLSVRAANCLQAMNITEISTLISWSAKSLMRGHKYMSAKVVKEIRDELGKLGLRLKGDE